MNYIVNRLKERSTWLGITTVVTTFGVSINPELSEAIISAGVAIAGLVSVIWPDKEVNK